MSDCIVCHNKTQRKIITYIQEYNGQWIGINGVPAEVCPICGEQYFDPDTVDKIQDIVTSQQSQKYLHIPLYEFGPGFTGIEQYPV
jgi:YgiT-type zinc finger domain-containing protein